MTARAALLITASLGLGCYNYLPHRQSSLVPSSYLSVTLTQFGSDALASYLGPSVVIVRGRLLSTTEQGLALAVSQVETRRGDILAWQGETVIVPREYVNGIH